jgi:transposase
MAREGLFDDLPEMMAPKGAESGGRPRLREPVRDQIELRAVDLDSLIGEDHPVRVIWAYVEGLDLSALEARIKAREGRPGHPPIAPRLLLALWLYATSEGVGSGRALEKLCSSHDAYRWLVGGVSVNYHTLSDFRVAHAELLDELLAQNVAALAAAGLVDLQTLAQDGIRVRAAAGAGSFRRRGTLEKHLKRAHRVVARLKRELDDDPDASNRRIKAARERAARERKIRAEAALEQLAALEEQRKRRAKTNAKQTATQKAPRASTTDPEARVMKMPDGGFRPAWNMQIASAVEQQIVVAVDVTASGSDRGLIRPMLEAIARRLGRWPRHHLADGGFTKGADIEWATGRRINLHCPPPRSKHKTDPFAPRADDGPGLAAWRRRMRSPAGKARYKRWSIAECINARGRQWTLNQITVRGRNKACCVLRWFALANNILQGHRLARLAAA